MRLVRLAVALTAVFFVSSAAQAAGQQSHDLQYIAAVENNIWVDSDETAIERAALIADAGFNAVRIFVPYSPGQAEIENDKHRLCSSAVAARKYNLELIVTIWGVDGHVPIGWAQVDRFIKTLNDHLYRLFGENGCTKDVKEFTVEILNEPNSKTFWRYQHDRKGNWTAPARYVRILSRVYPALKAKAQEFGVNVTVIAGALASSHDPLRFIRLMGEEKRRLKLKEPLFDVFSHHPYPSNSSEAPDVAHPGGQLVGIADYELLVKVLRRAFGYVPSIFYSEYGIETEIPKAMLRDRYWGPQAESVKPVSEATQARYYTQALELASKQPKVIGIAFFHLFDDPQFDQWQSGLYYSKGGDRDDLPTVAKSSLALVREAILGN